MKYRSLHFSMLAWGCLTWGASIANANDSYRIGSGVYDITGPVAGIATMGYAAPVATAAGLHQRIRARAFVIDDGSKRVAIVNTDLCLVPMVLRRDVVGKLRSRFGTTYSYNNVMITATHTHASPAGMSEYSLYHRPARGFSERHHEIAVNGIVEAITRASSNLQPGTLRFDFGDLRGANINRSIEAYNQNSDSNTYPSATDTRSSVLRFDATDGTPIGLINWFAVHGTSIEKDNVLISGDNKGFAAYMFEKLGGTDYSSNSTFIASFTNSNAGDASPNVDQDVDGDGDWECAANENFACAKESGMKQYESALQIYNRANQLVSGPIDYRHTFYDFENLSVEPAFNGTDSVQNTCHAAIGISMLAGSEEDGPGVGSEGSNCDNVGPILQVRCRSSHNICHGKKPVAVHTGLQDPRWQPGILPNQIFRIGQLALLAVPAEFTTMAGRRLRESTAQVLAAAGVEHVIIAGYANGFSSYVATREEYQVQMYEGASTLFNEWTLSAYKQNFAQLAQAMVDGTPTPRGPLPPNLLSEIDRTSLPDGHDSTFSDTSFGEVLNEPAARYRRGETASVSYQGSNPNHDPFIQGSYFEVERQISAASWQAIEYDWDWNTKFYWRQDRRQRSTNTLEWAIPGDLQAGVYRFKFRGVALTDSGDYVSYENISRAFEVH